ncbi:hypothetical protein BD289DRAFT_490855 [Coniella lustricola]|uniref:Cation-transporting P-type ATPase N-terminal domain-containing protein n=1 Tax=Coniella lustricola TaxID=2025994 RepID=A0A2T3A035_9PEZI|nr:hypothetical protein BD289DRAFT_490855 [Coniella lustricola]
MIPVHYRSLSQDIDEAERARQAEKTKAKDVLVLKFESIDWHRSSIEDIQKRLNVNATQGLSTDDAQRITKEHGKNKLSPLPNPWFRKIMGYLFKGFGSILCVGGILVLISWKPLGEPDPQIANLALGIVLIAVFLIQAAFNGYQDWSSSRVMQSITAMLPESCRVLRDGHQTEISALDIVPGDILLLKAGDRVPADVRYVYISSDMAIDRAVLTGESKPIKGTLESSDDNYLETRCVGLQGTHCVSGTATGIVVATGDSTVFGQIAKLTGAPKTGLTTIEKDILRFVSLIFVIMLFWIVLLAAVWGGWLHKQYPDWISVPALIVSCVSVAIAYIPEGLPIAVTSSLTITANLMRKNNILCKSLKTVETLGAVSVICSDKTGTLTKLRAIAGLCNASSFDTETLAQSLEERRIFGDATDQASLRFSESMGSVEQLRQAWCMVMDLSFDSKKKFMARCFRSARPCGLNMALPVDEASQFEKTSRLLLTVKGAPDILLDRCTRIVQSTGSVGALSKPALDDIRNLKDKWSSEGRRVILLARKILDADIILPEACSPDAEELLLKEAQGGLTFVGLLALIDPPRDDIPDVMTTLRRAGIRTFMVTGDFGLTAMAIARQCKMVTANTVHDASNLARFPGVEEGGIKEPQDLHSPTAALLLNGSDLMKLNDHQWEQVCAYSEIVFSRTTPDQKLRIVREFQARDKIVAMTGDGVNDAPALKAADIGISLATGSDIAIEAADMVLLDSFSAIVEAVRYGRLVFDNLKKVIAYLLPAGSWSEFWPVFTNVFLGLPQILSSFLMIIICCFTDCIAAIVLAYEKPEADLLLRPPRDLKTTKLVNWQLVFHSYAFIGTIEAVLSFSMAYWYLERSGIPFRDLWFGFGTLPEGVDQDYYTQRLNEASSIYFVNLVVMQWFTLMSVRTRHLSIFQHPPAFNKQTQNLLLFPAILLSLGFAVIWLYPSSLQIVLNTSGVPIEHYFIPAALGLGILCLDEGRKAAVRRWPGGLLAKMAW